MNENYLEDTLSRMSGMAPMLRQWIGAIPDPSLAPGGNLDSQQPPRNQQAQPQPVRWGRFTPDDIETELIGNAIHVDVGREFFLDDQQLDSSVFRKQVEQRIGQLRQEYRAGGFHQSTQRIVIIGAGPVGLRCAIGAALTGHRVTVIEQFGLETRARYLGLFAPEQRFLASLGAPLGMFVELCMKGVLKRLVTIADLTAFLRAIAEKLGVDIRMLTTACYDAALLSDGIIKCIPRLRKAAPARVIFDVLVDASGAGSRLREILIGKPVTGFHQICQETLDRYGDQPDLYFSDKAPRGAGPLMEYEDISRYWKQFKDCVREPAACGLDHLWCFLANMDYSVFRSRIPDLEPGCPPGWIWKRFRRPVYYGPSGNSGREDLFRVHLEGPFPRKRSRLIEKAMNQKGGRLPLQVIQAFLMAGRAGELVDPTGWENYCRIENSLPEPAHRTAGIFPCSLTGILAGRDEPCVWGTIPGKEDRWYYIAGDAAQTPWYRFGVGIMDGFYSARVFEHLLGCGKEEKNILAQKWEQYLRKRAVQILFSTFLNDHLLDNHPLMDQLLMQSDLVQDRLAGGGDLRV